jgi:DNA-binding SARP family transcriptional activator
MLELNLFGIPQLCWEGESLSLPSPKNLAILSYLALKGESVSRKDLSELFWKEGKPSNVRFVLHKLREIPSSESWLETNETFICVKAITDVKRFENAVHDERYGEALEINSGEVLLKGLGLNDADDFINWLDLERSRLSQLYLEALQGHISELERVNKVEEALNSAKQLLGQDRLNENVHRAIMRLEHKRGNTEAALAQFETLRNILKEELDVEPLEDTLRLLREIEGGGASSAKHALLLTSPAAIPAKPDKLFGRDKLLDNVAAHLAANKRVLLHGFGGAGKTAVATLTAATWLEQNKAPVLWLQAGDDSPNVLFDALARAFDAQQTLSQGKDATKTIRDLLTKHKISLFVLDDVWNAYALSKIMEAIPESVPLLVTSRQRYPKLTRVDVGRLERKAALELLSHFAALPLSPPLLVPVSKQGGKETRELCNEAELQGEMDTLCELLGDHAFALRIAGITLAVDGLAPGQLLERIANAPHTLKTPLEFDESGRESVAALLGASLTALSEEAYEAFMGFGVLFTTSCTAELLSLCTRRSEEETEEALINLHRRGLAERVSEAGSDVITYRLHDLAYSFAKANNHFRLSTAQRACQVFLKKHQQDFNVLDAEITNLLGATEATRNGDNDELFVELMRLLVVGNSYYTARGHNPRSLELLKASVAIAKQLNNLETAHYLATKLGDVYREFYNETAKAMQAYESALELARNLHDHHREASLLSLIGITRFSQGETDASDYLDQAYALAKSKGDDLALSQILQHKSYLAGVSGTHQMALQLAHETIEVAKRLKNDAKVDKARAQDMLFFGILNSGVAEQRLGYSVNAKKHFDQALQVALESNNKVWTAYTLQELGEMYHYMNERELAQRHYNDALALYQQNNAKSDVEALVEFMRTENYVVTKDSKTFVPTSLLTNALQTPTTYSFSEGEKPFERSQ